MVSTRQSSNSSTNTDGSILCCDKSYDAGPSGTSRRNQHSQNGISHSTASTTENSSYISLLDLPVELLQKIMGYLDYNSIARLRPVCHQMDKVCGSILNSAFQRLQTQMLSRFQAIKAQMPRRESARRNHPLACESDIIETLHMRLTLLQMSFGKHIERKHCCFFPGEILDEVNRILHYIRVTPKLARPYKVTDELFDLSTMAMEYFKDCIEPTLPEIPYFGAEFLDLATTFSSSSAVNKFSLCLNTAPLSVPEGKGRGGSSSSGEPSSPSGSGNDESGSNELDNNVTSATSSSSSSSSPQSNIVLRKRIRKIKQGMKRYNSQLSLMRRDLRTCKSKIAEQQKQIVEYSTRLDDHDKKNEETSRKFSTLLQELNKCKTELQYWRSKSPAIPVYFGCGGQSLPGVVTDDFQSLANQGNILSNVEASIINESLDFIPIADVAARSPTEREMDGMLGLPIITAQLPQASSSNSNSCISVIPTNPVESMAPPKAPVASIISTTATTSQLPLVSSSKRKSTASSICSPNDDDATAMKKPRRVLKSRQAKRSKI